MGGPQFQRATWTWIGEIGNLESVAIKYKRQNDAPTDQAMNFCFSSNGALHGFEQPSGAFSAPK
jgi:hypothetical protein